MAIDLHGVVQHPADGDYFRLGMAIEQQMTRAADDPVFGSRPLPTVPQVIGAHCSAQFRAGSTPDPSGFGRDVAKGRHQEGFITRPRDLPEVCFGVRKECRHIFFRQGGDPEYGHILGVIVVGGSRTSPVAEFSHETLKIIVTDISKSPFVDIPEPGFGRLSQHR